jgi:threonine dehydrogenase-like Zn-dependent dehydrogenase
MLALVYDGQLRVEREVPRPVARPGEALVRVRVAGICNTDLEILRGYKGFRGVPGHEFVGEVCECSDAAWVGRRVCGEINVACGSCRLCEMGLPAHCLRREVLGILGRNGAFAEYLSLPVRNLHPVPSRVGDDEAVFVEPLAAAFEILEQVTIRRDDRVVVLGDGKLGNLSAQVIALTGANPVVLGKHPEKLALLRERGIEAGQVGCDLAAEADLVVEATGSSTGLEQAMRLLRPRGTLVLKSTTAAEAPLNLSDVVVKELTVVGSRCGPFPRAISALVHHEVEVRPLISDRFALLDGIQAVKRAREPGVLKVLLDTRSS